MRDFFKKLFSGKEPETVVIHSSMLPQMIHEREATARTTLVTTTAEPIRNIRNAAEQLKHIVNTIAGAEHDPEIHPKLKSIAKNTLPQFIRSMKTALAKDLPEDPEEFYLAAVESVKSCLNSIRGPGRYLQIVFPEEIKAARKGIDAMGLEINEITKALAIYRKETTLLNDARARYLEISSLHSGLEKAGEKDQRIERRTREIVERISAIDHERTRLMADPRMSDAQAKRTELVDLENHRNESARAYASLSMTASHVLRKAEKIAIRQKHQTELSALQHAMFLLSDHELPDTGELHTALVAAGPVASRMIDAGEIPLKNKEERAVFSDISSFCTEICTACGRLMEEEARCRDAQETLEQHPAIVRMASLDREQAQLHTMLQKELDAKKELAEWQKKENNRIPLLKEELRKKVEEIMGKNVQFQDDDLQSE